MSLLDELGRRRLTNVLLEGGAEVLGSFVDEDAIDEYHVFISPRIAGGREARPAVGGLGVEKMADALKLARWEFETLDGDLYVHGWRR
jgi:diaminohydroxyphosphoribosylaminopyrimidine deaminase/5-amino-6-(5-phosphoribosylamino)uracil reductase